MPTRVATRSERGADQRTGGGGDFGGPRRAPGGVAFGELEHRVLLGLGEREGRAERRDLGGDGQPARFLEVDHHGAGGEVADPLAFAVAKAGRAGRRRRPSASGRRSAAGCAGSKPPSRPGCRRRAAPAGRAGVLPGVLPCQQHLEEHRVEPLAEEERDQEEAAAEGAERRQHHRQHRPSRIRRRIRSTSQAQARGIGPASRRSISTPSGVSTRRRLSIVSGFIRSVAARIFPTLSRWTGILEAPAIAWPVPECRSGATWPRGARPDGRNACGGSRLADFPDCGSGRLFRPRPQSGKTGEARSVAGVSFIGAGSSGQVATELHSGTGQAIAGLPIYPSISIESGRSLRRRYE